MTELRRRDGGDAGGTNLGCGCRNEQVMATDDDSVRLRSQALHDCNRSSTLEDQPSELAILFYTVGAVDRWLVEYGDSQSRFGMRHALLRRNVVEEVEHVLG